MTAEYREDWSRVEKFNNYLLEHDRFFIQPDRSDRYRAELGLAKALIHLSSQALEALAFAEKTPEAEQERTDVNAQMKEARTLLNKLRTIEGSKTADVSTRIRAKDMLNQLKSLT